MDRGFPGRDKGGQLSPGRGCVCVCGRGLVNSFPPSNFSPSSHSTQLQFTKSAFESNPFLYWERGSQPLSDGGGPISSTLSQTPWAICRHAAAQGGREGRPGPGSPSPGSLQPPGCQGTLGFHPSPSAAGEARKRLALCKQQAGSSASRPPPHHPSGRGAFRIPHQVRLPAGRIQKPEKGISALRSGHLKGGVKQRGFFRTPHPGPALLDASPGEEEDSLLWFGRRIVHARQAPARFLGQSPPPPRTPYPTREAPPTPLSAPRRGTLRPAAARLPLPPGAGNRPPLLPGVWSLAAPRKGDGAAQRTCTNGRVGILAGGPRSPEGNPPHARRR